MARLTRFWLRNFEPFRRKSDGEVSKHRNGRRVSEYLSLAALLFPVVRHLKEEARFRFTFSYVHGDKALPSTIVANSAYRKHAPSLRPSCTCADHFAVGRLPRTITRTPLNRDCGRTTARRFVGRSFTFTSK